MTIKLGDITVVQGPDGVFHINGKNNKMLAKFDKTYIDSCNWFSMKVFLKKC